VKETVAIMELKRQRGPVLDVCLDFGDHCTLRYCPVTGVDSFQMGYRRTLLPDGARRLLKTRAWCAHCGDHTTMGLVGHGHFVCLACGVLSPRAAES